MKQPICGFENRAPAIQQKYWLHPDAVIEEETADFITKRCPHCNYAWREFVDADEETE